MVQDYLDSEILKYLQRNSKLTYEEIGEIVDRSPSTVRDRIKKLEENKTITGYSVIVDHEKMSINADAYVAVSIPSDEVESVEALKKVEGVSEILRVTGRRKIMFRLSATDNKMLSEIIDKKIRPLGFYDIEITMILEPVIRYPGI